MRSQHVPLTQSKLNRTHISYRHCILSVGECWWLVTGSIFFQINFCYLNCNHIFLLILFLAVSIQPLMVSKLFNDISLCLSVASVPLHLFFFSFFLAERRKRLLGSVSGTLFLFSSFLILVMAKKYQSSLR